MCVCACNSLNLFELVLLQENRKSVLHNLEVRFFFPAALEHKAKPFLDNRQLQQTFCYTCTKMLNFLK